MGTRVYIDCENVSSLLMEEVKRNIESIGAANSDVFAFADFSNRINMHWKQFVENNGYNLIQVDNLGTESSDIMIILDILDYLSGICSLNEDKNIVVVSSDGIYANIIDRIHAYGATITGIMTERTKRGWRRMCDRCIIIGERTQTETDWKKVVHNILENNRGNICIEILGGEIRRYIPDFDPKNIGYKNLKEALTDNGFLLYINRRNSISVMEK